MFREQEPVNQYKSMFALIVKGLEVLKSCLILHLDIMTERLGPTYTQCAIRFGIGGL
jgi:hypothetical protein